MYNKNLAKSCTLKLL